MPDAPYPDMGAGMPPTPAAAPSTAGSTMYQTAVLSPGLVQSLIQDDSPDILWNRLWEFLGVDIPVADIKEFDFKNILDFVDLNFLNLLQDYPESKWEEVMIVEYELQEINGKTTKVPIKAFKLSSLWDSVRAKVYLKMCRARDGFTLKQLTETRTHLKEELRQSIPGMPGQPEGEQKQGKKWGVI